MRSPFICLFRRGKLNGHSPRECRACAEFPPIAAVISVLAFVWGYTPMTSAVVGAAGCAYVLFKYRATFVKALMFMVKKVTRPFTR